MERCLQHPYAQRTDDDICWACEEQKYKSYDMLDKLIAETYVLAPKDAITRSVMEDLSKRASIGLKKYNTTLEENNHQNMLQHGYGEALDLAQYLKKEITTLNTIQDLVKQHSNDEELGRKVRELYSPKHD